MCIFGFTFWLELLFFSSFNVSFALLLHVLACCCFLLSLIFLILPEREREREQGKEGMRWREVLTGETQGRACSSSLVVVHLPRRERKRERETSCCCLPPSSYQIWQNSAFLSQKSSAKASASRAAETQQTEQQQSLALPRPTASPRIRSRSSLSSAADKFSVEVVTGAGSLDLLSLGVSGADWRIWSGSAWCGATPPHGSTAPTGKL